MISIKPCAVAEVLSSKELIAEYAAECSIPAIGEINPQHQAYAAMEACGMLQSFMVQEDGEDIGFVNLLTPTLPHYGKRTGVSESLFIREKSRSASAWNQLKRALRNYAEPLGCCGILLSAPSGGKFEQVLELSKDCERTNAVFFWSFA